MIKATLIDDESQCRNSLSFQLKKYCPQVQLLAQCNSVEEGLKGIAEHHPELVFLDMEMPEMIGFEILQQIPSTSFEVIFTTECDNSVSQTNRLNVLDVLRKPIKKDQLLNAVAKVGRKRDSRSTDSLENVLVKHENKSTALHKIALPIFEGFEIVSIDNIIYCLADSNYTHIVLKQSKKILVSRTLKEIEKLLEGHGFLRVHHSHLINLNEIVRYVRGEGGYLMMSDNTPITVSRSHKEVLLQFFAKGFIY